MTATYGSSGVKTQDTMTDQQEIGRGSRLWAILFLKAPTRPRSRHKFRDPWLKIPRFDKTILKPTSPVHKGRTPPWQVLLLLVAHTKLLRKQLLHRTVRT